MASHAALRSAAERQRPGWSMTGRPTVYIDGNWGTTGFQIKDRLLKRTDLVVVHPEATGEEPDSVRAERMNGVDLVVLCWPADKARAAVQLVSNAKVKILDTTMAFRTANDWTYGFAEWEPGHREEVARARHVSNPSCYGVGSVAILRPLASAGALLPDVAPPITAVSGYSGGGVPLIRAYEGAGGPPSAMRCYSLMLEHYKVEEIRVRSGLTARSVFTPMVAPFFQGMLVSIPLLAQQIRKGLTSSDALSIYEEHYGSDGFISARAASASPADYVDAQAVNGTNEIDLIVCSDGKHGLLAVVACLDNLGKGAAGQAEQNINLMLGLPETSGLVAPGSHNDRQNRRTA